MKVIRGEDSTSSTSFGAGLGVKAAATSAFRPPPLQGLSSDPLPGGGQAGGDSSGQRSQPPPGQVQEPGTPRRDDSRSSPHSVEKMESKAVNVRIPYKRPSISDTHEKLRELRRSIQSITGRENRGYRIRLLGSPTPEERRRASLRDTI